MDPKFLRNQKRAKKQVNTKTPTHTKQRHEFAKVLTKRKVLIKKNYDPVHTKQRQECSKVLHTLSSIEDLS